MSSTEPRRAVLQIHEDGSHSYYADPGVTLYIVDENAPSDRIYETNPFLIPGDMLSGPVGRYGEGPEHARAVMAVSEINGVCPFSVVREDYNDEGAP